MSRAVNHETHEKLRKNQYAPTWERGRLVRTQASRLQKEVGVKQIKSTIRRHAPVEIYDKANS